MAVQGGGTTAISRAYLRQRNLYSWGKQLENWARVELARPVLWIPVFIGLGIALYFGLKTEPVVWLGPACLVVAIAGLFLSGIKRGLRAGILAVLFVALGFTAGSVRTHVVTAPILKERTDAVLVEGELVVLENRQDAVRYLVDVSYLENVSEDETPEKVRVVWRGVRPDLKPGDAIRIRAILSPLPKPVMPGGYDYARQLFYERIGGVGYAVAAPVRLTGNHDHRKKISTQVELLRIRIAEEITSSLSGTPPQVVAVCIALVTGKRDGLSDKTEQILRDAGLAHLLAISGLHMGLISGILFFSIRFLLACSPYLALNFPIKKWAAMAALVGAFGYLLLSGAGWSTRRAFIMVAVVFLAMIIDRRGISLRNVAIAAVIILLTTPEALFQAGFQMSFAAVTVLIAAYEWYQVRRYEQPANDLAKLAGNTSSGKLKEYFFGLSVTSILAGFATAPFGLYHFNRYAAYGLAGNLLAMPVMGFVTMTSAVLGFALMPFGLDQIGWWAMAKSVVLILAIAEMVAAWPGAVADVAAIGSISFYLFIFGGLLLCLLKTPLRLAGGLLLFAAMFAMPLHPVADIIVGRDGRNMAFRIEHDGRSLLVPWKNTTERFAADNWLRSVGQGDLQDDMPDIRQLAEEGRGPSLTCSNSDCLVTLYTGQTVQVLIKTEKLREACQGNDMVIVLKPVRQIEAQACDAELFDIRRIREAGAISIRASGDKIRIQTNTAERGIRPWTGKRGS